MAPQPDNFFSCDWGTSSFRLRLIRTSDLKVIAEVKNGSGIAETCRLWQQQKKPSISRVAFYAEIINGQISILRQKLNIATDGIPVILSGMASSTIGMVNLPYKRLPFKLDGSDLKLKFLTEDAGPNPFMIVSGARTANDVMRGEETKVVGCASVLGGDDEKLLLLPGTHPKHIVIKGKKVTGFKTYMTGEFFNLLSEQSILSASVAQGGDFNSPENQKSFVDGVAAGHTSNLLHAAFMVRTNQVLHHMPEQQNLYYLSGLLLGSELSALKPQMAIYLVGGSAHAAWYRLACSVLNLTIVNEIDADDALIKGQYSIFGNRCSGESFA